VNNEQQDLVIDLALKRVSRETFLELFFSGGDIPENYVRQELETALGDKDADSVECALTFGYLFSLPADCSNVLSRLLGERWHTRHEDIASALQILKCPASVDSLFEAALAEYSYIGSEYALGVKCIHALCDIGTDNAREKLRILAQGENPVLAERAGRLLATIGS